MTNLAKTVPQFIYIGKTSKNIEINTKEHQYLPIILMRFLLLNVRIYLEKKIIIMLRRNSRICIEQDRNLNQR